MDARDRKYLAHLVVAFLLSPPGEEDALLGRVYRLACDRIGVHDKEADEQLKKARAEFFIEPEKEQGE